MEYVVTRPKNKGNNKGNHANEDVNEVVVEANTGNAASESEDDEDLDIETERSKRLTNRKTEFPLIGRRE